MKQKLILLLACLLVGMNLHAADVLGRLIDNASRKPIDFANVSLYKKGSTAPLGGTVTDADGYFVLYNISAGEYTVICSFMGYIEQRRNVTIKDKDVNLGRIFMDEDTQQLQEVEVVGQGSTMRFELDKKVFSVDQNIASAGGSASDVLENIPSVDVDQEGNISMRNNESVEIWINGKPAGLTADNRAQVMEQLPAESIKEIEIITNPSAKFSPEGTAGIINIVMKKDRKAGYYGSVNAGLTYSLASPWNIPPGGNIGFNINLSKGPVDAYFNAGYRYRNSNGGNYTERYALTDERTGTAADTLNLLVQDGTNRRKGGGMFLRAGVDVRVGEYSTIGVSGMGMVSEPKAFHEGGVNSRTYLMTDYASGDTLRYYDRTERNHSWHPGGMAMVDYRLEYQKHKLMVSASYGNWGGSGTNTYEQQDFEEEDIYLQEQLSNNRNNYVQLKADYEWKPTQQSRLEAGYNGNINWGESSTSAFNGLDRKDSLKAYFNDFSQPQQIHALYITYGNRFWDRLSIQVGLRGEYAHWDMTTSFFDQTGNWTTMTADTTYWQLYPSAYISYSFPNDHELQLNYTRRVDRPWGGQLNPRMDFSDSTNIRYGNPLLRPSYSSSLELNYLKTWEKHTISAGVFYRFRDDIVQNITYRDLNSDANIMKNTYMNIAKRQEVGLEVVGKNRLWNDFLQLTTSVNVYYNTMTEADYNGTLNGEEVHVHIPKEDIFSWSARLNASFMFTKTFSGQLTGRYRSPRVVAQGTSSHSYSIDLGLRKTFLDRKLALAFNVRDILNSRARSNTKWGEGFWQFSENRWNSRMVSVSLSYNFGNMRQKPNKHMNNAGVSSMMEGGEGMSDE